MTHPLSSTELGLRVEIDGAVSIVTLDRPEKLNALSHGLVDALRQAITELGRDGRTRALVLTGTGRAFSAGADLGGGPSDAGQVVHEHYNPLIAAMVASPVPLIAAVNGIAAGAGVSLAAACDLRVASTEAAFQLSFVRVGLIPDAGATWLLPRLIGLGRAQELALLGRKLSAETAERWGLVNELCAPDALLDRAKQTARDVAELSASVGTTKAAILRGLESTLPDQLEFEAMTQGDAQHTADYEEARQAFRERRRPVFAPPPIDDEEHAHD